MASGSEGGGRALAGLAVLVGVIALTVWWVSTDTQRRGEAPSPLPGGSQVAEHSGFSTPGTASAPGVNEARPLPAPVAGPAEALPATPGLPAAWARLLGRVVRPDGSPVADVSVIYPLQPGVNLARQLSEAHPRTASDGRFEVLIPQAAASARAALMVLDAAPTSRALLRLAAPHAGDTELGDLVLQDGAGIAGRILSPDGAPVPQAAVQLSAPPGKPELFEGRPEAATWQNIGSMNTGDDGRFFLRGLPGVSVELSADALGFEQLVLHDIALQLSQLVDLGDLTLGTGRVIDGVLLAADGAPVGERQVLARAERSFPRGTQERREDVGQTFGWCTTDAHGRFRLGGLQPGVYELDAWAEGHAFTRLHGVADGQHDVVLRLRRAGRVLLSLRDGRTLAPLGGAQVEASMAPRLGSSSNNAYSVSAGPDVGLAEGLYLVDGCGEDSTLLSATLDGYAPAVATIEGLDPGAQRDVLLDLAPRVVLSGVIEDQFERPVAGATVQAASRAGPAAGSPTRMRRPAEDGLFRFDDVAPGTWHVWAYAAGHASANENDIVMLPEGLEQVIVRLPVLGRAAGLVATIDGTPVARANVVAALLRAASLRGKPPRAGSFVIGPQADPDDTGKTASDAEGRFALDGLWPGTWLLTATLGPAAEAQARLDALVAADVSAAADPSQPPPSPGADVVRLVLVDGELTSANLVLSLPARLDGRALSDGRPLAGAKVVLATLVGETAVVLGTTETDGSGVFAFEQVAPGRCVVVVASADEVAPRVRRVTLHEGEHAFVEVSFSGPALRGVVLDTSNRRPVGEVVVSVFAGEPYDGDEITLAGLGQNAANALHGRGLPGLSIRADDKGRFEIPRLPPGRWSCRAEGDRWLSAGVVSVELPNDWTPEPIEVLVSAGAVVQGSIRYAFGGGWPRDVDVYLYSPERDGIVKFDGSPKDGHYRIGGLLPGTYELRLRDMKPGSGEYVVAQPITLTAGESATVDLIYPDS